MLVSVNSFEEKLGQPISIILEIVKHFYINMKTLLKKRRKRNKKKKKKKKKKRDKCWLLFKTSFMKPLVTQFTLEPLFISFVSFFAVGVCLINLMA